MSAEGRMLLILIYIFSNSYPTPTPNSCLKCFSRSKLLFERFPRSNFKFFVVFGKNFTPLSPKLSLDLLIKLFCCTYKLFCWWKVMLHVKNLFFISHSICNREKYYLATIVILEINHLIFIRKCLEIFLM